MLVLILVLFWIGIIFVAFTDPIMLILYLVIFHIAGSLILTLPIWLNISLFTFIFACNAIPIGILFYGIYMRDFQTVCAGILITIIMLLYHIPLFETFIYMGQYIWNN